MSHQPGFLRRVDSSGVPGLLARVALGLVFIYTGYNKAVDPASFLKLMNQYHLFPHHAYVWMNFLAIVLPWLEILCGVLLVAGIAVRGTALLVAGMLIPFTVVVTMRAIGIHNTEGTPYCQIAFDCGCGTGPENFCWKFAQNTILTLLGLLLLWSRTTLVFTNILAPRRVIVKSGLGPPVVKPPSSKT
jgi:putative oxidoreductase